MRWSTRAWLCGAMLILAGCSAWDRTVRSQSPDEEKSETATGRLVGDLAVPWGLHPVRVEAIGLVNGLRGTGSDPEPDAYRAALLADMQARSVRSPNMLLASPDTALVLTRAYLRPGLQKGERFDLEVRVPSRSDTTSLRGGWLLQVRMSPMEMLGDNRFHGGEVLALAEGAVLVDPAAKEGDKVQLCRGRVLGGGVCLKSRPMGLVLKSGHQTVFNSSRIATAINRRFHQYQGGVKEGVAKAKTHQFIELVVHPRYKDNISRYMEVIRALSLRGSPRDQLEQLESLEKRLLDPVTAAKAALQLESVGTPAIEVLKKGIRAKDEEVRFYSAEALAYLDDREAAPALGTAARDVPAFRVFALTALSAMDDFAAYEQLRDMLGLPSIETRYGAFRALWAMNPDDPLVLGEQLGGQFSYHRLNTPGEPLIHVTRSRRAEIVLFGADQRFATPVAVEAGNQILVTSVNDREIAVSRFAVGEPDQKRVVSTSVNDVIRAIVELGGTYPDVIQALQAAKTAGSLTSRFAVDALPEGGRRYERTAKNEGQKNEDEAETTSPSRHGRSPMPDLFAQMVEQPAESKSDEATPAAPLEEEPPKKTGRVKAFFAKMIGSDSE